jgi:hypothetical protein
MMNLQPVGAACFRRSRCVNNTPIHNEFRAWLKGSPYSVQSLDVGKGAYQTASNRAVPRRSLVFVNVQNAIDIRLDCNVPIRRWSAM